jgi:hypothetical protein
MIQKNRLLVSVRRAVFGGLASAPVLRLHRPQVAQPKPPKTAGTGGTDVDVGWWRGGTSILLRISVPQSQRCQGVRSVLRRMATPLAKHRREQDRTPGHGRPGELPRSVMRLLEVVRPRRRLALRRIHPEHVPDGHLCGSGR